MKPDIAEPRLVWTDYVLRTLKTSGVIRLVDWIADDVVPLLLVVFIAAPLGVVIWLFFIPKFVRNAQRRQKYNVQLSVEPISRIAGVRPTKTSE